ncbi:hypothetical protein KPL74_15300 [Bacillus sp. NP157]|nr:hypothetical protein KPL74_15300 [Bacillus sp. NP157]
MIKSKRFIFFGVAGLMLASMSSAKAACMDGHPSVRSELKDSQMIVVGTATEEHVVPDPDDPEGYIFTIYVIHVSEVLKGPKVDTFWLYSENTTARYPMDLGVPNLLFVETLPDNNYVSSCGNSGPMEERGKVYRTVKKLVSNSPEPAARSSHPANGDAKDAGHAGANLSRTMP